MKKLRHTKTYQRLLTGADLFVIPNKVTRLVAETSCLSTQTQSRYALPRVGTDSHKRLSEVLEEEIPAQLR